MQTALINLPAEGDSWNNVSAVNKMPPSTAICFAFTTRRVYIQDFHYSSYKSSLGGKDNSTFEMFRPRLDLVSRCVS